MRNRPHNRQNDVYFRLENARACKCARVRERERERREGGRREGGREGCGGGEEQARVRVDSLAFMPSLPVNQSQKGR